MLVGLFSLIFLIGRVILFCFAARLQKAFPDVLGDEKSSPRLHQLLVLTLIPAL